jgi:hypothetical protein
MIIFVIQQDMKVESVPFGIGRIVEGSERTLISGFESDEREVNDETYKADKSDSFSKASSVTPAYPGSNESEGELEDSHPTQSASDSVILLPDSCDNSHFSGSKSNDSVPDRCSLVESEP